MRERSMHGPTNRMSCFYAPYFYMCATPAYVWCPARWNVTSLLAPRQDVLQWIKWEKERERDGCFKQIGLLASQLIFAACVCQAANVMKPSQKDVCPAFCQIQSWHRGIFPTVNLPNVIPVFVCMLFPSSSFLRPLVLPACIFKFLNCWHYFSLPSVSYLMCISFPCTRQRA